MARTPEERAEASRLWRLANKDRIAAQAAARYAANREACLAKSAANYAANKEKYDATKNIWRAKNKEKIKEQQRAWHAANPDKAKAIYETRLAKLRAERPPRVLMDPEVVKANARAASRAWCARQDPERIKQVQNAWRAANPDKVRANSQAWKERNPHAEWKLQNPRRYAVKMLVAGTTLKTADIPTELIAMKIQGLELKRLSREIQQKLKED